MSLRAGVLFPARQSSICRLKFAEGWKNPIRVEDSFTLRVRNDLPRIDHFRDNQRRPLGSPLIILHFVGLRANINNLPGAVWHGRMFDHVCQGIT